MATANRTAREPIRITVELDRGARFADRVEHVIDPDLDRIAAQYEPSECVAPHLEERLAHRGDKALGHPIFVELEALVHARDHDAELGYDIGRHVERAVFEDVCLGAVDDSHGRI